MYYLKNTMDTLFEGRSATDKGTIFHIKVFLNHRSVTKQVSESFNYTSDFLKFVTESYVVAMGMRHLGMENMDDDVDLSTDDILKARFGYSSQTLLDPIAITADLNVYNSGTTKIIKKPIIQNLIIS